MKTSLTIELSWYFYAALLSCPVLASQKDCQGLAPDGTKEPCGHSVTPPPMAQGGESEEKGKTHILG